VTDLLIKLIPLFPLLAVILNGFFGKRYSNDTAHRLAWGSVGLSFLCSIAVFVDILRTGTSHEVIAYQWIFGGDLTVNLAYLVDPLTCMMLLVVTGVGLLIHIYSVGYMSGESGFTRFFTYMNLFMVSMLLLVMGNNYVVLFIGWEGVGLCSYLLIGYYYDKVSAAKAASKAFVVNRIGDAGFLLAIFLIFVNFKTLDYTKVFAQIGLLSPEMATAIALCLLVGAVGKSAQLPLYTWLPDAMEGPTPVSALIHAATMVTAGVYMIVRNHVPDGHDNCGHYRRTHRAVCRDHWPCANGHQARVGLFNGEPTRVHVSRVRDWGLYGCYLPPHDPCLLQGPLVPHSRIGDPCALRRARHSKDGRP
jgi:NADH-quinone oxidoreductase subunit L